MRVYEFSKKSGIASKELVATLKKAGFDVTSHMSVLDDKALKFLEKDIAAKPAKSSQKKPAQEKKVDKSVESLRRAPLPQDVSVEKEKPKSPEKATAGPIKKAVKKAPHKTEEIVPEQKLLTREAMMLADAAEGMGQPVNELILTLLKWGTLANKNMMLPEDLVEKLAQYYEIPLTSVEAVTSDMKRIQAAEGAQLKERLPVVVVLGHVDHGKTTLLDYIRKTRVAAKEKGGITQHLGAYEAKTDHGNIVFLDTPGHAAFSKIRSRGVKVADIAILVVAADDGVMPQTVEAIKRIKEMKVPVIVAINKVDKVEPMRIEATKRDLSQYDLLPEEWGGDTICAPISALKGIGITELLEMVVLQAQLMELKADIASSAKGYVLESKLEKGRGPVATLICQHGSVRVGDYFVAGNTYGKVSSLVESRGKRVQQVKAPIPVQVAGFSALPEVGDYFEVVPKEDFKRLRSEIESRSMAAQQRLSSESAINIIVKADSNSSKEALIESIEGLSKKVDREFHVIQSGIGDITEGDVILADNTGSKIVALHVKMEPKAQVLAHQHGVTIYSFDIIYKLLEFLEEFAIGAREVVMVRKKIGEAEVRRVFDIKKLGVIAGCYVTDGSFKREGIVVGWRGNEKIGEGKIKSLQREKRTVKEVHSGYECGFIAEDITDWQEGDRVECYIDVPEGS